MQAVEHSRLTLLSVQPRYLPSAVFVLAGRLASAANSRYGSLGGALAGLQRELGWKAGSTCYHHANMGGCGEVAWSILRVLRVAYASQSSPLTHSFRSPTLCYGES